MTNIFLDGFDFHDASQLWTGGTTFDIRTSEPGGYGPRTGTRYLRLASTSQTQWRDLTTGEEDDGMFVGFGYLLRQDFDPAAPILRLYEAQGATKHLELQVNGSSRGWKVVHGDGTTLIDLLPNVLIRDTWHYIELGVKVANAGGTVELRQDGATLATFTGDTRNGGSDGLIDRVEILGGGGSVSAVAFDDLYVNNEQGSAPDNTFWGDTRLFPHHPNGNGNYSQLVGSDGNSTDNYLLVDEVGPAVESDYVGSATDGDKDTYTFEDLPVTVGTVRAVEIRMHAWKTDAGAKSIRSLYRRSSTDTAGADKVLAVTGAPYIERYAQDPLTAAAWTITNFNASEFGAEVRP